MGLEIRRARPEDRPAALEICAHTWENGDYIPFVWDEWLADEAGPLLVAVLDGRVVALEKISWTSPTEVWLEGMRVHPDHRKAGIATALFRYSLRWATERGARIARLATGSSNQAVHRMVAAVAFRLVHRCRYYEAPGAPGETLRALRASEAATFWDRIQRWPAFAQARGLYTWNWAWQPLTHERFVQHVSQGEVWAWTRGRVAALAVVQRVRDPDVGLVASLPLGTPSAIPRLLRGLRNLALEATPPRLGIFVPEDSPAIQELQETGYSPAWNEAFWVFEGSLPAPE